MFKLYKVVTNQTTNIIKSFSTKQNEIIEGFKPLFDRVLVKRKETQSKTESGIYVPDSMVKNSQEAIVCSVGDGKVNQEGKRIPMIVKKGDTVLIPDYGGIQLNSFGKDYLLFYQSDLLAIINN
ncbi:10 kda heat shock protein [Anaeramoeba ignava]|uniref:20 kDa chaperonin, chloroplastic n=1 Tax=Anaeramoeba ignava TaxID=1746090 RepID=A0A9Q0RCA5_ANAIG|nr:10 kda heat shock protein [Anaeramoeba ignava]